MIVKYVKQSNQIFKMIDISKIDKSHQQYWNTCLFSNYAVCCNYFTGVDIKYYFEDYLREFEDDFKNPHLFFNFYNKTDPNKKKLSTQDIDLNLYLSDYTKYVSKLIDINFLRNDNNAKVFTYQFHIRTYEKFIPYNQPQIQIGGYKFLKLLHDNINQKEFIDVKSKINVFEIGTCSPEILQNNVLGFANTEQLKNYMKSNEVLVNAMYKTENGVHSVTIYYNSNSFWLHDTNTPTVDQKLHDTWTKSVCEFLIFTRI